MSALQEAICASRNARLVHDENQQELVAIPVKDWEAVKAILTAAPALAEIGRLLARITADPIFVVQQKVPRVAAEGHDYDRIEWRDDHGDCDLASDEEAAELEAVFEATGDIPKGWDRLLVKDDWQFVTACFTENGCEDYLRANGHNLREPRIYVESGFRNAEWQLLRAFLLLLAASQGVTHG